MAFFLWILPGLVLAFVVLAFSLSDDMPAIRQWFWLAALALIAFTAVAAAMSIRADAATEVFIGAGPAAFLLVQAVLRAAFLTWKGEEPVVAGTGTPGEARFFYEKDQVRRVTAHDYLYTFLLGLAMLLTAAPAGARLLDHL